MELKLVCLPIVCLLLMVTHSHAGPYTVRDSDGDDGINTDDDDNGGLNPDDGNGKTIDEIIVEATNKAHGIDSVDPVDSSDPHNKLVKIEYDIVLTEEEFKQHNSSSSKDRRTAALINGAGGHHHWPNQRIPYEFEPNTFSIADKNQIHEAMNTWAKYTCLTFPAASSGNRIQFRNGDECSSPLAMAGGVQALRLAPGCRVKGVVLHELGHAIGIQHEQTRPDRDEFITIIDENVIDDKKHNFKKESWKNVKSLGIFYDYLSIMHYGPRAFSKNKKITIETNMVKYQNVIGQRKRLSFRDIKSVNWLYNCAKANKCKLTEGECPGEGFVGKDCKCWCPGDPYVLCSRSKNQATGCQDYNYNCPSWAKQGNCRNMYKQYMETKCPKSCGLCKVKNCQDENKYCEDWARNGECPKNPKYMLVKCKKSCNVKNC